jgi:subtilisin family serine protease
VGCRPILLALLLLALAPGVAAANPATQIIVKRDPGLTAAERADIRADAQVRLVETLPFARTELVAARPGDVQDALYDLQADPDVSYAQLNHRRRAFAAPVPDDEAFPFQLGLHNVAQLLWPEDVGSRGIYDADIDAPEAWNQGATGAGQTVAVVDTGISANHEDIDPARVAAARNFVGGEPIDDVGDGNGHGTHVAGTIAATADNGVGVAGVAPDADLAVARAIDDFGFGTDAEIAAAFDWAGDEGYRVVNASLGGDDPAPLIQDKINDHPNTLYVVAAGNDGRDNDLHPTYPCDIDEPNIVCVGATTNHDEPADFSNHGDHSVDLFAPGEWVLSTIIPNSDSYAFTSGTSMASPHVAAVAALALEADPTITTDELKDLLLDSVDRKDELDESVSGGRLNAGIAVARAYSGGVDPPDADLDGVFDAVDLCPNEANPDPGLPEGCPVPHSDGDAVADWYDNCDLVDNADQADTNQDGEGDTCDADIDGDSILNPSDNCPTKSNPSQRDAPDGDGLGDPCDADRDNDGVPNTSDLCADLSATGAYGCPAGTMTPQPADSDRDGVADVTDACPRETAATRNGCPLAEVASLSAKAERRSATVRVSTTGRAMMRITVERKRGRRWVRVARRTRAAVGNRATLKLSRLKRGTHRVRISISSSAGNGTSVSKSFRVR